MAGELIQGDWEFEYRGLLLAKSEGYRVAAADGLDTLPDVRRSKVDRPRASGSLLLPNYADERVVTLEMRILGDTDDQVRQRIDALAEAMSLIDEPAELVYKLPGIDARTVMCRPTRRSIPTDRDLTVRAPKATVQLIAEDPLIYSAEEFSDTTGVGSVVGGLEFPLSFPLAFGIATPGTFNAVNSGAAEAPWTATLTGPLVSPKILHVGKQQALELNGFTLAAGQTLVFDQAMRTVLLNGTASRSGALTRREWFTLSPGSNLIQLDAASGGGQLTMTWRSCWL